MDIEQKIKVMAESKILGMTKLIRLGGSYALTVPKMWLEFNATEVEGDYYCQVDVVGNTLIFRPIKPGDIEAVVIKERKDDRG